MEPLAPRVNPETVDQVALRELKEVREMLVLLVPWVPLECVDYLAVLDLPGNLAAQENVEFKEPMVNQENKGLRVCRVFLVRSVCRETRGSLENLEKTENLVALEPLAHEEMLERTDYLVFKVPLAHLAMTVEGDLLENREHEASKVSLALLETPDRVEKMETLALLDHLEQSDHKAIGGRGASMETVDQSDLLDRWAAEVSLELRDRMDSR